MFSKELIDKFLKETKKSLKEKEKKKREEEDKRFDELVKLNKEYLKLEKKRKERDKKALRKSKKEKKQVLKLIKEQIIKRHLEGKKLKPEIISEIELDLHKEGVLEPTERIDPKLFQLAIPAFQDIPGLKPPPIPIKKADIMASMTAEKARRQRLKELEELEEKKVVKSKVEDIARKLGKIFPSMKAIKDIPEEKKPILEEPEEKKPILEEPEFTEIKEVEKIPLMMPAKDISKISLVEGLKPNKDDMHMTKKLNIEGKKVNKPFNEFFKEWTDKIENTSWEPTDEEKTEDMNRILKIIKRKMIDIIKSTQGRPITDIDPYLRVDYVGLPEDFRNSDRPDKYVIDNINNFLKNIKWTPEYIDDLFQFEIDVKNSTKSLGEADFIDMPVGFGSAHGLFKNTGSRHLAIKPSRTLTEESKKRKEQILKSSIGIGNKPLIEVKGFGFVDKSKKFTGPKRYDEMKEFINKVKKKDIFKLRRPIGLAFFNLYRKGIYDLDTIKEWFESVDRNVLKFPFIKNLFS